MADITEEHRKKIYNDLADVMIAGMERGELDEEQAKLSARFVLERLDNIKTEVELKPFLEELAQKWPAYQGVLTNVKAEEIKKEDATKINEIQSKLSQLIT